MSGDNQADASGGTAGQPNWGSWQDAIRSRLTRSATIALLLSPFGLLLIAVARVLMVSDYSTVSASAIVTSGGYINTLLGTIIPILPLFLPYLALVLLFFNRVILAIVAIVATALISPVAVGRSAIGNLAVKDLDHILDASTVALVFMGLLAFVLVLLLLTVLLGLSFTMFARTVATIAGIALIPFVCQAYPLPVGENFYTDLIRQPWLPAEMLTMTSGQVVVGYVLADSGITLTVLMDGNREVHYYPDTAVTSRQVCEIGPSGKMRPLVVVPAGSGPSQTPACRSEPADPARPAHSPADIQELVHGR